MKSINSVHLLGHVGDDPKITSLNDNTRCANFSLATTERWKDKVSGEMRSATEWHRIVVFNQPLVNVVEEYVKKGDAVYLEGELKSRKYTNKEGKEINLMEIILKSYKGELIVLNAKGEAEEKPVQKSYGKAYQAKDDLNDDIPF